MENDAFVDTIIQSAP